MKNSYTPEEVKAIVAKYGLTSAQLVAIVTGQEGQDRKGRKWKSQCVRGPAAILLRQSLDCIETMEAKLCRNGGLNGDRII